MAQHKPSMHLTVQTPYLANLRSGLKSHEGRLARPQYLTLHPGDYIQICSVTIKALEEDASIFEVRRITRYETFREMLLAHGVRAFLPEIEDVDEAVQVYRGFPGYAEGEVELGVVGIELRLAKE